MNQKTYFHNLDGLRTVACLMVFFWHALHFGHNTLQVENPILQSVLLTLFNGKNGVSVFFVLSGFLITYLLLKEVQENGKINLLHFYVRRVLRIWPLYFLVVLLIFVVLPVANYFLPLVNWNSDVRPIYYFTFLGNFDVLQIYETGGTDFLPSSITWSVAIEEQFYLFWPLLFMLVPISKIQYALFGVIGLSLAYRLLVFETFPNRIYFHSLSAAFDLAIGGAAAWLSIYNNRVRIFFVQVSRGWCLLFLAMGFAVMYGNIVTLNEWLRMLFRSLQVLFFAAVILYQCFNKSAFLKFSRSVSLTGLGKFTYGMYMLHPLVLLAINTFCIRALGWQFEDYSTMMLDVILGLPLTIICAKFSYRFIEKNFLVLKDRFGFVKKVPVTG